MFTAQRVHVAPNHEVSPRIKLLLFSIYLGVTFAIVKLWMVIIKEENVYYETAAAFATIFVLTTILWLYYQLVRKHRERQEEIRRRNRISSPELNNAAIETIHRRLLMRRAYGENVDFFMEGGAGLSAEIINNLLHHSIYSTDSVSCKPTAHVNRCGDIECGCVVEHNKIETQSATTTTGPTTTTFTDTDIAAVRTTLTGVTTDGTSAATCTHHECAVCLSEYLTGDSITELPCGHVYHRTCITSWLLSRNLCPMCKQLAVPADLLDASLESQLAAQAAADLESGAPSSSSTTSNATTTAAEHTRRPVFDRSHSASSTSTATSLFSLHFLSSERTRRPSLSRSLSAGSTGGAPGSGTAAAAGSSSGDVRLSEIVESSSNTSSSSNNGACAGRSGLLENMYRAVQESAQLMRGPGHASFAAVVPESRAATTVHTVSRPVATAPTAAPPVSVTTTTTATTTATATGIDGTYTEQHHVDTVESSDVGRERASSVDSSTVPVEPAAVAAGTGHVYTALSDSEHYTPI